MTEGNAVMDKAQRAKMFADMLNEVINDTTGLPKAAPAKPKKVSCGCEADCGYVAKHDENTVLVGVVVLDSDEHLLARPAAFR
jgi:hypothetical protein